MPEFTPEEPPRGPQEPITDLLRGVVAREANAARQAAAPEGTRLRYLGNYELLGEIARGGMGIVYRARQESLNREVAIKMILSGELADEEAVARFHAEAEAAANLQHPNIVAIHEIGEHEGQHYFSMALVEGKSLAEMVRERPLSPKRAATYVRQIAEAIHYAHGEGTLHRDLKPPNVLIDGDDQPQITDFGLAKRLGAGPSQTLTGAAVGTPSYMPPEQAAGRHGSVGPASDVYALGALLYELLTGRPPFRADSPVQTLIQVLEHEPAAPRAVNPSVPPDLETISLKCLDKRPSHRYPSAQELADDLGRYLARKPIVARPASRLRVAWTWTRNNPWAITAAAVLIGIALLGLTYFAWTERAYWQYVAAHPEYEQAKGPRYRQLRALTDWSPWAFFLLISFHNLVSKDGPWARRFRSKQILVILAGLVGSLGLAWGLWLIKLTIDAFVWDGRAGTTRPMPVVMILINIQAAAQVVLRSIQAMETRTWGAPGELSQEQEDQLIGILLDGPRSGYRARFERARQQYMEWASVAPAVARLGMLKLAKGLHSVYPGQIPRRLTPLQSLLIPLLLVGGVLLFSLLLMLF